MKDITKRIILKPKSMQQWLDWTERLDDAGCEWQAVPSQTNPATNEYTALSKLLLHEIDAKHILGVEILEKDKN